MVRRSQIIANALRLIIVTDNQLYLFTAGHSEVVRILLEAGANVNQSVGSNVSPLHAAARSRSNSSRSQLHNGVLSVARTKPSHKTQFLSRVTFSRFTNASLDLFPR